jgi:hypothetical protein
MGGMCQSNAGHEVNLKGHWAPLISRPVAIYIYAASRLHFPVASLFRGNAFPLIMRKIQASVDAAAATSPCAKKC